MGLELVGQPQVRQPACVAAGVEAGAGVVAQVRAELLLGQVQHRGGEAECRGDVVCRVHVDLVVRLLKDVQPVDQALHQLAAPVVRGAQQQAVGLVEHGEVGLVLALPGMEVLPASVPSSSRTAALLASL